MSGPRWLVKKAPTELVADPPRPYFKGFSDGPPQWGPAASWGDRDDEWLVKMDDLQEARKVAAHWPHGVMLVVCERCDKTPAAHVGDACLAQD